MSTTLTINLTQAMVDQIDEAGVFFQIALFGNNQNAPLQTPEVIEGTDLATTLTYNAATDTYQYVLTLDPGNETILGGKVYFIVQSSTDGNPYTITAESQISADYAQQYNFRYDSMEFALTDSGTDAANLTSVNGFGFGMLLEVPDNGQTASYSSSANTFFDTYLHNIGINGANPVLTYDGGPLNGQIRGAVSPTSSPTLSAGDPGYGVFTAAQWHDYVQAFETNASTWNVGISGYFAGGADHEGVYHNAAFYGYTVSYDGTYIWLNPTADSQVQGYIRFTEAQLEDSIYSTLGSVQIFASPTDSTPYTILDNPTGADMNVGLNNQWGAALTQFLIGFTAGYYGVSGSSPNSSITSGIDLGHNWNWDPTYAFGRNLMAGDTPTFMDPYAQVFFNHSNSYGSGYSDALMSQYQVGGPLITIGTSSGDVSNINLTLFGDNETPTNGSTNTPPAYTQPVMHNYIAPVTADYDLVQGTEGNTGTPRSVTLSFTNGGMQLADGVPVTLRIYGGLDVNNDPIWHDANIGTPSSNWTTWNFQLDGSNNYLMNADGSYQVVADPNAVSTPGAMTFAFLPTTQSGVAWYQVVVGEDGSASQKIYNIYTTTDGNYLFETDPGQIAVDGLATVTSNSSTPNTFSVNFLYGTHSTLDSALLQQYENFTYNSATPNAPVAGIWSGGLFDAADGQTSQVSNTISVGSGAIAFGWTGDNDDANTSSWISGRTNKVNGLNIALLDFVGGPNIAPAAAIGDLDGQWTSNAIQLGNGTYTVTSREYSFMDTSYSNPLAAVSSTLTLTVNLSDLDIAQTAHGVHLLDDPTETDGNWISLQAISSSLPPEATLILYRTDGSGHMLDSYGAIVSDLQQATLGYVGSVLSDSGGTLFNGNQMVYLALGQEMRFAIQTGTDSIDMLPSFSAVQHGDGSMLLNVGGIQLNAETHNTLDAGNNLASVQRIYDLPMVYLTHGQELTVQVAGSAANTNDLHFAHFDVNLATGEISIGGVQYGDTPEFHAALLANLDAGYGTSNGGGTFSSNSDWTVAGTDGFYVPVLITQSGDIFVPGNGNSGGQDYIRMFGENTFGFEDLTAAQGSDFDYNDMVMRLVPHI